MFIGVLFRGFETIARESPVKVVLTCPTPQATNRFTENARSCGTFMKTRAKSLAFWIAGKELRGETCSAGILHSLLVSQEWIRASGSEY